jgi:excisionase family DNA binding protein
MHACARYATSFPAGHDGNGSKGEAEMSNAPDHPNDLLTVNEVARRLRLAPRTVRKRIADGDLAAVRAPGERLWRVPVSAYWEYAARLQRGGPAGG